MLVANVLRSKSLWQWYIITVIDFLDIIHHPVFYLKTTFRRLDSVLVKSLLYAQTVYGVSHLPYLLI
jgi:hypothetical protein